MEYRRLGKSGLSVSEFSLGSWVTLGKQVDQGSAKALMTTAYDAGINFFDNAEGYESGNSEILMGQGLLVRCASIINKATHAYVS